MILSTFQALLGWLPAELQALALAAIIFFFLFALFRLVKTILDMIPFL